MKKDHTEISQKKSEIPSVSRTKLIFVIITTVVMITVPGYVLYLFFFDESTTTGSIFNWWRRGFNAEGEPKETLGLITCGWERTGTSSIVEALEQVGYRPYHGKVIMRHEGHFEQWINSVIDPEAHIDEVIEGVLNAGYDVLIDWPKSLLCVEIAKRFPQTKVLLSVRDSPEVWMKSFNSLYRAMAPGMTNTFPFNLIHPGYFPLFDAMMERIDVDFEYVYAESIFPWVNYVDRIHIHDEELMKQRYSEFIQYVHDNIEEERLLEFNVKQGWEPLAKFLNIDESIVPPGTPFPHSNKRFEIDFAAGLLKFLGKYYPFLFLFFGVFLCVYFKFVLEILSSFLREKNMKKKDL